MRRGAVAVFAAVAPLLAFAAPASGAAKNVVFVKNLAEAKNATAINFLQYEQRRRGKRERLDVMVVTGRFGVKTFSLKNPRNPVKLDEVSAEDLRLEGDPPVDYTDVNGSPKSTFWQNEDMDVDQDRKLLIVSRDPRAYGGSTSREPGQTDPNNATNIAGFYVVSAKDPADLKILSFQQLPTGHTTTCVNRCRALWSGGPASTTTQRDKLGWTGRPLVVTDLRDPSKPVAFPTTPIDLFRKDGVTAYSHDVQVDAAGVAWVSGDGGTRGYWTEGSHFDPIQGKTRKASALQPIPYGGGGLEEAVTADTTGGFEHNAWRPVGAGAPKGDARYKRGELLLATEEDFGPALDACRSRGQFTIASLKGSLGGEAWRSTPEKPFRLTTVGKWSPYQQDGGRPGHRPYDTLSDFCSAHYFDVDGSLVTYAWYGEGTRFLDISDPANPRQVAYWRPDDGIVWASYMYRGLVYTADRTRGVDILRLTSNARKVTREVVAPEPSRRQRDFVARHSWRYAADPGTSGLCVLQSQ